MSTATITDPHALASAGLVRYTGDINPLHWDGAWYDASTWKDDGYASCVRVTVLDEGPDSGRHIIVEKLTINKPKDMGPALRCCGLEPTDPTIGIEAEIESCLCYGHYDPDCSDWREAQSYAIVIPDDKDEPADFRDYIKIHNARIMDDAGVWELLGRLIGRDLYCGPMVTGA